MKDVELLPNKYYLAYFGDPPKVYFFYALKFISEDAGINFIYRELMGDTFNYSIMKGSELDEFGVKPKKVNFKIRNYSGIAKYNYPIERSVTKQRKKDFRKRRRAHLRKLKQLSLSNARKSDIDKTVEKLQTILNMAKIVKFKIPARIFREDGEVKIKLDEDSKTQEGYDKEVSLGDSNNIASIAHEIAAENQKTLAIAKGTLLNNEEEKQTFVIIKQLI